jgi:transposase InsO family protein
VYSDQDFQYQHPSWRRLLQDAGAHQSMSRKGNCYDNAVIENLFGQLKKDLFTASASSALTPSPQPCTSTSAGTTPSGSPHSSRV